MATVFGHPMQKPLRQELVSLGILLTIPALVAFLMMEWTGGDAGPAVAVSVGGGLGLLMLVVYWRLNPMAVQRIFRPAAFQRNFARQRAVLQNLSRLDHGCVVFNDVTLELLRVEHLVITTGGIFVIGKVHREGGLHIVKNTLFAGDHTLETLTGNIWRQCHLLNIILKKWFNTDYMPKPVLVVQGSDGGLHGYDGMVIVTPEALPGFISRAEPVLDTETAGGLVHFLRRRYAADKQVTLLRDAPPGPGRP